MKKEKGNVEILMGLIVAGSFLLLVVIGLWGVPKYRIYKQDLAGQANLRQQEWEKKILIEAAKAEKESAALYAEAEVERARGVAEANEIIAEGLQNNEEYLHYLWIQQIEKSNTIYVPTEANLPILEARN